MQRLSPSAFPRNECEGCLGVQLRLFYWCMKYPLDQAPVLQSRLHARVHPQLGNLK